MHNKIISLILAVIIIAAISSCRPGKKNEEIFSEFEGEEGMYIVKLPPLLFLGLLGISSDETQTDQLGDIDYVKLLIYGKEGAEEADAQEVLSRLQENFDEFEYENVMGMTSSGTFISAYILNDEEYISDLMVIIKEDKSLVCLGLSGKLNGNEVFNFATELEYDKLRNFISTD